MAMDDMTTAVAEPGGDRDFVSGGGREAASGTLLLNGLDEGMRPQDGSVRREPGADGEAWADVPLSPQEYGLSFPDGISVDQGLLDGFTSLAYENGLPRGVAQQMAALYVEHVKAGEDRQGATLRAAVDGWETEIKATPTFAADKGHAQRALAQYGSPELFAVMDETLIGSHPAVFAFMAKIGKALAEPEVRGGMGGSGSLTAEKILYPNMK